MILSNETFNYEIPIMVHRLLKNALITIDLEMYWLTDRGVLNEIKSPHQRGVKVRILISNTPYNRMAKKYLESSRIDIRIYDLTQISNKRNIFHKKTLLIDCKYAIIGSCDFTPQGLYFTERTLSMFIIAILYLI